MGAVTVSNQAKVFVTYKQKQQQFFSKFIASNQDKTVLTTELDVNQYIKNLQTSLSNDKGYHFLDDNISLLTQEFTQLADILQENAADQSLIATKVDTLEADLRLRQNRKVRDKEAEKQQALQIQKFNDIILKNNESLEKERLMYIHYAVLLMTHAHYYHGEKSDQVKAYQKKIKQLIQTRPQSANAWYTQVLDDMGSLANTPLHTSKIRGWIGFINIYRIHTVMCRLTWKQTFQLARQLQWLDHFDTMLGIHFNVGILDSPAAISNVLSVGLFASRFMLNAGLILKHTFAPTSAEKGTAASERFWRELKKRHWVMVNDIVWTTANALTNYSAYFHVSDPAAGYILAGFLLFDALWLGWRLYLDEQTYLTKKAQYEFEITQSKSDEEKFQLKEQLRHLSNDRYSANAGTIFNMSAAFLLTVGFSASMLFASPVLVPMISFFVCTVAVGMYLSGGKFAAYVKETLILEQDKTRKAGTGKVLCRPQAKQEALNDFLFSWAKNTLTPLFIVGLYTVSLPAAIVLTLLYIGYECSQGYTKQAEQLKLAPLKLVEKTEDKSTASLPKKSKLDESVGITKETIRLSTG